MASISSYWKSRWAGRTHSSKQHRKKRNEIHWHNKESFTRISPLHSVRKLWLKDLQVLNGNNLNISLFRLNETRRKSHSLHCFCFFFSLLPKVNLICMIECGVRCWFCISLSSTQIYIQFNHMYILTPKSVCAIFFSSQYFIQRNCVYCVRCSPIYNTSCVCWTLKQSINTVGNWTSKSVHWVDSMWFETIMAVYFMPKNRL